ncbi:glycosyltransferase [Photobacterium sp. BZF1]|uniref:glycosyltransferase n=1 Tax=Photobacterium sp. BZF1 TaxID=1904457 RepID=UPI001653E976|nr:glycosyltransferase [Photobacterium sp. BZF1]MBC7005168.1 glycosyltransferase [Photobacterium sp. BZF1]
MNPIELYKKGNVDEVFNYLNTCSDSSIFSYLAKIALAERQYGDALLFLSHSCHKNYSQLFELLNEDYGINTLINCHEAYFSSNIVPSELKYVVYMTMVRNDFLSKVNIPISILISMFQSMTDAVYNAIRTPLEYSNLDCNANEDIDAWVLCSQFLGYNHGPTLTALTVANNLSDKGLRVGIICTNSFNFDLDIYSRNIFKGNFIQEYSNHIIVNIEDNSYLGSSNKDHSIMIYKGAEYPYYSLDGDLLARSRSLLKELKNSQAYMISIGDSNLYADIVARYCDIYNLPCSFTAPRVNFEYPAICRQLTEYDGVTVDSFSKPLVETRFPYSTRFELSNNKKNKLKDKNIKIALVGSRLEQELNHETLTRLSYLVKKMSKIRLVFIGVELTSTIRNALVSYNIPLGKVSCTGFVERIEKHLSDVHFYFNPRRKGGGTSVLEALALGIPPICFKYGDGFHTAGDYFGFEKDEDVLSFIESSSLKRDEIKSECHNSYLLNTNVKQVITDLTRGEITF